jgi:hypothetical protein
MHTLPSGRFSTAGKRRKLAWIAAATMILKMSCCKNNQYGFIRSLRI